MIMGAEMGDTYFGDRGRDHKPKNAGSLEKLEKARK